MRATRPQLIEISQEADRADAQHRALSPPYGSIAVGGAHMDPFFRSEALRAFIHAAAINPCTPADAVQAGNEAANFAVKKWNASRGDYQVHRALNGEESHLWHIARRIIRENEQKAQQPLAA